MCACDWIFFKLFKLFEYRIFRKKYISIPLSHSIVERENDNKAMYRNMNACMLQARQLNSLVVRKSKMPR